MNDEGEAGRLTCDVTLAVTSYNHQEYVEQCLDSIFAQTRRPRQVIVIDDSSRDDSADVIERWLAGHGEPYEFVRHESNRGICASLNEALQKAEGKYFCQISADDWEQPNRLERQVAAMEASTDDPALIVSDIREVDGGGGTLADHDFGKRIGNVIGAAKQSALLGRLLAENVIPAPGVLLRTDRIREIGGYDENLAFEDYDMWLRLATRFPIAYEPGVVANYRVLASSMLRDPKRRAAIIASEADMLSKHIGDKPENNEIIARRLLLLAGELLEIGVTVDFRHVLKLAISASDEVWMRNVIRTLMLPGGLSRVRRRYADRFGLANHERAA